jgi:hypothetical protein
VLPVSIAVHGSLVYVANAGPADADYAGFRLSPWGGLIPIPGSTGPLPSSAQPGDVLFNSTGTELIGTRVGTSQIDSFAVGFDGRLTAAPGSPFTAQGLGPFGSQFRPTNPSQLFVSNAHNGTGLGTMSAFADSRDGSLTPIGTSPYADQQTAPCWVSISPDGQHLFSVNTGSGAISRYIIAPGGQLTLLGSTAVAATGGVGAVDSGLSPGGRYLYVNESCIDSVGIFTVSPGGGLTELPGRTRPPPALAAVALPAATAAGTDDIELERLAQPGDRELSDGAEQLSRSPYFADDDVPAVAITLALVTARCWASPGSAGTAWTGPGRASRAKSRAIRLTDAASCTGDQGGRPASPEASAGSFANRRSYPRACRSGDRPSPPPAQKA